jgi:hypothetical protein
MCTKCVEEQGKEKKSVENVKEDEPFGERVSVES